MTSPVDEKVYLLRGKDSSASYVLPKPVTLHYAYASDEPVRLDGFQYVANRKPYCDRDHHTYGKAEGMKHYFHAWERWKVHETQGTEEPIICEACWRKLHLAQGQTPPKQNRPVKALGYELLPVQDVVQIVDGERITPANLVKRGDSITTMGNGAFRNDGQLRAYRWSFNEHQLGVRRNLDDGLLHGTHAYYDADREAAANEMRMAIRIMRRNLEEAEQQLLELYEEDNGQT